MVSLDDYKDVRSCLYKEREYLVRDNGCVFRKSNKNKKEFLMISGHSEGKIREVVIC